MLMDLYSSLAMRTRAEVGSPWLPVQTMTTFRGGSRLISPMVSSMSGDTLR